MVKEKEKKRFGVTTKQIFGNATHTSFNGVYTMSTVMPVEDLLRSCSFDLIPSHLQAIYKEIQRVVTPQRRNGFEDYCYKHMTKSSLIGGVIPPVLIGCMSEIKVELSDDPRINDSIIVHPESNFVVDGLNRLSTIATVLGGYDTNLIKKSSETDARRKRRVELSALLPNLSVQVVFIFRRDRALREDDFSQIFADVNGQQSPMSTNRLMKLARTDEVVELAREIGSLPLINSHGGMAKESSRVTEKSEFIITLNTLTRFVLGAIGGYKLQTKVRGVREMYDGAMLTSKHIEEVRSDLLMFFDTWVEHQGESYSEDRTGFQLVTTLVQAVGLVFNRLWTTCSQLLPAERTNIVYQAAKKLGSLDYSRCAEHWRDCEALVEENGSYKVITGGASSRRHFAVHLCSKIGLTY
ncbi:DNA sulfur modification protein DndB [Vibrio parahaemolyticus]|uniref:DNA sulfur modification protein DndB n=1 Tax=Vibrio parahaemolyticus TaxID=670 RepID=UPI001E4E3250|nr:DNA sulfur modification protein DndB [Vibrio parahaemolyticus]